MCGHDHRSHPGFCNHRRDNNLLNLFAVALVRDGASLEDGVELGQRTLMQMERYNEAPGSRGT